MEATAGFEPTNRGFAVPRLKPLGHVAPVPADAVLLTEYQSWRRCPEGGAEEEI